MKQGRNNQPTAEDLRISIALAQKNFAYLKQVGINPDELASLKRVISFLGATLQQLANPTASAATKSSKSKVVSSELSTTDDELLRLTGRQIVELLADDNLSRAHLERLASVRFAVTRGALSNLRSRKALVDKLRTLVAHEGTHESISRVALSKAKQQ